MKKIHDRMKHVLCACCQTIAVLIVVLILSGCAVSSYPENLSKYVKIIEETPAGGFSDFRKDVSEKVCPIYREDDFVVGTVTSNGFDLTVSERNGQRRVEIMITRPFKFKRAMLIESRPGQCSAYVESYYL